VPVEAQPEGVHTFIEFGNRMLTFAVLVTAVASLVVVLRPALARRFGSRWGAPGKPRRSLVLLASAVLLGIFGQAVLGGITVLLDLHPAIVAAHFLLSMLVIAAAYALYRRAIEPGDQPRAVVVRRELEVLARTIVVGAFVVLVLGTIVTGTGPHSGDADEVVRFGLDPRTISWVHSDAVLVFVGLALAYALGARLTDAPPAARQAGWVLIAACIVQGSIGYAQYFSGLPIGLVSLHMLGACLVWLAAFNTFFSTRVRGHSATEPESLSR
jgi:cytochrome c oxidase assembly protein subunit 15